MSESVAKMILKCEKTGKLFFSEAEAKQHADDTGFSAFAQVSPEEKVWVCAETGKVCFNEQQMSLHKQRVPEAITWTEQTVADMHEARAKKAAEEAAGAEDVEMETEEDQLLRAAGKAPKGKSKAKTTGPALVTKEVVEQLVEMGFSELRAQKALVMTSNGGIEGAINWLTEHLEDADIDDANFGEFEVKPAEEVSLAAAQALAGVSHLSAEEKKQKLDELLAKARAKKMGTSVEEEKQKEKARRDDGKKTVQSKRELEEQQRKRDADARKREKREFEEERAKLKAKLEADRQEKIKNGLLKPAAVPLTEEEKSNLKPLSRAGPPEEEKRPKKPMSEREREAMEQMSAMGGMKRNYDEEPLTLEEATAKLCAHADTKVRPALDMMQKMVANIAKAPAEAKYRQLRLSNPKVAEGLVFVPGARQYLHAIGWVIGPGAGEVGEDAPKDCISLPLEGDGVAQAAAQQAAVAALVQASNAAVEKRRLDELAARNKEIADKLAKQKAEKEAMKAAMARDRAEVAARGPAQASIAKKLPTESGGTMTSAIFSEQEEAEGRRNAQ